MYVTVQITNKLAIIFIVMTNTFICNIRNIVMKLTITMYSDVIM